MWGGICATQGPDGAGRLRPRLSRAWSSCRPGPCDVDLPRGPHSLGLHRIGCTDAGKPGRASASDTTAMGAPGCVPDPDRRQSPRRSKARRREQSRPCPRRTRSSCRPGPRDVDPPRGLRSLGLHRIGCTGVGKPGRASASGPPAKGTPCCVPDPVRRQSARPCKDAACAVVWPRTRLRVRAALTGRPASRTRAKGRDRARPQPATAPTRARSRSQKSMAMPFFSQSP